MGGIMANKRAKKTATRTAANRARAVPTDKATMVVTLYDGTREPIEGQDFLIRIFDGFQNQLFDDFKRAPTTVFSLPFHDNLQDNCIVVATGKGHVDAGFSPVKLSNKAVATVDLMLLEDKGDFKFQTWAAVGTNDPVVASFISVGSTATEAQTHYDTLRQTKPAALASLLNLATAMKAIQLPSKTPLDYFKEILWDESLAQDRFFGYADKSIVDQVRRAAMEGEFRPEPNPGLYRGVTTLITAANRDRHFPIAPKTGTFVPLPTPTRGRRMPARKRPEGHRGEPARQTPRQHQCHNTRGRVTSAAFSFGENYPGRTLLSFMWCATELGPGFTYH
jgi:hypothetical protein